MKYIFVLCSFAILLMLFVGCGGSNSTTPVETTPMAPLTDTTAPNVVPDENGFVVIEKRYIYLKKDLVILSVENRSDKNYTVTVTGRYLDSDGNVIKTQKQTFTGWAAGYHNYFLFRPNRNFADFQYTLEVNEYTGECLAAGVSGSFVELKESAMIFGPSDLTVYPAVTGAWKLSNSLPFDVFFSGYTVLFDNMGGIYGIYESPLILIKQNQTDRFINQKVYQKQTEELVWPAELAGEVSGAVIVKSVERRE